jgi:hypothetical protein
MLVNAWKGLGYIDSANIRSRFTRREKSITRFAESMA